MSDDFWKLLSFFVGVVLVVAIVTIGIVIHNQQEVEQMKACVSAGSEWKLDAEGNYYICIKPSS